MNDDQGQQNIANYPEGAEVPVSGQSGQSTGSTQADMPSEAPESPMDAATPVAVENQNKSGMSDIPQIQEVSAQSVLVSTPIMVPTIPTVLQTQSTVQQDQTGFIHVLLAKAQAKIQFNRQRKLEKIIHFAQKEQIVANEDIQKLLHISSATATRYLVELVEQGRLTRVGNPRDARYQFLQ